VRRETRALRRPGRWCSSRPGRRALTPPAELQFIVDELVAAPGPVEAGDQLGGLFTLAVFALAERLTGVRVTEELLRDAEYQLGHVPEEPAEEWTSIVIDITDAHGERFYKEVTRDEVELATARARAQAVEPIVIRGPSSPTT
jgi:hypothetical protein